MTTAKAPYLFVKNKQTFEAQLQSDFQNKNKMKSTTGKFASLLFP